MIRYKELFFLNVLYVQEVGARCASGGAWFRMQECERRGMVPYARGRVVEHGSVGKSARGGAWFRRQECEWWSMVP